MAGDAREKNTPDRVSYTDWSAMIVREELHKAGWRLADLLTQTVGSTSINSTAGIATPEPIIAPPGKDEPATKPPVQEAASTPTIQQTPAAPAVTAPGAKGQSGSDSDFGAYPANYKEIVIAWMKKYSFDASRIEWQSEPKPSEMPNPTGRRFSGYLVIFNTPDHAGMKTRSVLIRDGVIVSNSGF